MNDCSDPTNIRLRKFSISACCFTVILICGTWLTLKRPDEIDQIRSQLFIYKQLLKMYSFCGISYMFNISN